MLHAKEQHVQRSCGRNEPSKLETLKLFSIWIRSQDKLCVSSSQSLTRISGSVYINSILN
jgi:hypothetical protein